jgi:tetratricopeptide (TPR) repeat protein
VLWGAAWFLVAAATLTEVYPDWSPNRALFATVGIGVVMAALCDAGHPAVLGALVVLRLGLLALAPGVPDRIATQPPSTGASLDFAHLARLQLLVRDTRRALADGFPRLPHGSRVAWINMPHAAEYAFAGSRALQVWYRDTTLAWIASSDVEAKRGPPPVTVVAFQSHRTPQVVLVETAALAAYDDAVARMQLGRIEEAFALLDRADSLQRDRRAEVFLGGLRNVRAYGLYAQGRGEEAAREAARSLAQWPENAQAHALIGFAAVARGDLAEARIESDRASAIDPDDPSLRELRRRIGEAEATRGR